MKKIEMAILTAFVFCVLMSFAGFDAQCSDIRDNVLRLHILANSDSKEDQQLKLCVRDKILETSEGLFDRVTNKEEAIKKAEENIELLQSAAEEEIARLGYDYPVTIEVGESDFNTRVYENVTLPAGRYMAVRVLIGQAEGKNWWCVMFPTMCIPAASQVDEMSAVLPEDEVEIVDNENDYKIGFKTVEWYEKIKSYFN